MNWFDWFFYWFWHFKQRGIKIQSFILEVGTAMCSDVSVCMHSSRICCSLKKENTQEVIVILAICLCHAYFGSSHFNAEMVCERKWHAETGVHLNRHMKHTFQWYWAKSQWHTLFSFSFFFVWKKPPQKISHLLQLGSQSECSVVDRGIYDIHLETKYDSKWNKKKKIKWNQVY